MFRFLSWEDAGGCLHFDLPLIGKSMEEFKAEFIKLINKKDPKADTSANKKRDGICLFNCLTYLNNKELIIITEEAIKNIKKRRKHAWHKN